MLKKRVSGSYTIELALLFPMIISVVVLIIYIGFYFHDRSILYSAAYQTALRGSQMINHEDKYANMKKLSNSLINNRLIATKNIQTDLSVVNTSITVKYSGNLSIPAGTLLCKFLTGGNTSIIVSATAKTTEYDAINFIRKCRFIENTQYAINHK